MKIDEVIEMARESGMDLYGLGKDRYRFVHHLEAFAKLVVAKYEPKIAIADAYRAGVDSGIAAEREACAKVCEDVNAKHITEFGDYFGTETYATDCAKAIRARGEA